MRLIEINQGLGGQQEAITKVRKVTVKDDRMGARPSL